MGLLDRLIASLEKARAATNGDPRPPRLPAPRAQDTALYGTPTGTPARSPDDAAAGTTGTVGAVGATGGGADDAAAIARYRYMLRTASPDAMEQAHTEAFARLTPEQRRSVLDQLSEGVPASERPISDDPGHLARAATRAEVREPGSLERLLGRTGAAGGRGGIGIGGLVAGGLLASVAGGVIGSAIGGEMFGERSGYGGGEGWAGGDGGAGGGRGGDDSWGDGGSDGWTGGDGDFF